MAFIGNNVTTQGFTPAIDYFSGNGSTVTFTLSRPVASVAQVIIAIDNVVQNSSTAYSVSGNSITFTSAPLSGTNNIWVQYTSPITTYAAISQDPSVIGDITATGGFLSTGDFGNTYTDGTIVDYVTGMARITTGASDGITLYNGGTSARNALMTIDSSGKVGIGTTSPSTYNGLLNVKSTDTAVLGYFGGTTYASRHGANSSFATIEGVDAATGVSSYQPLQIGGSLLSMATGGTERMRIDSSGNVGIGSAPDYKLDVGPRGGSQSTTSGSLGLIRNSAPADSSPYTQARVIVYGGTGVDTGNWGYLAYGADANLRIVYGKTGSVGNLLCGTTSAMDGTGAFTERMRVDTSGNLLVGNGSTGVSLEPNGQAYKSRIWNANSSNIYIDNNSSCGYVFSNGAASYFAATTAASFNIGSDYRLKENITPLTGALDRVDKLKPVRYSFKQNNKISMPWGSEIVDGFLAHEFAEVVPTAVTGEKDAIDENGEIAIQTLDMTKAIPLLVAAIKEQQAIIEDLKARIETLEAK